MAKVDAATAYAAKVLDGKVKAGRNVINACQRHMDDLNAGVHDWRPARGQVFVDWCKDVCTVDDYILGTRVPFILQDWQLFVVHSLFSWIVKPNDKLKRVAGTRRFRRMVLEGAKGCGKSALCTAIDLYLLTSDYWRVYETNEERLITKPTIFITASNMEQARQLALLPASAMIDAKEMPDGSNIFKDYAGVEVLGGRGANRIICYRTNGYIEAATARSGGIGKAGLNLTCVHSEEVHELKNPDVMNVLEAGFKGAVQPLMMIATNTGRSRQGVGWSIHQQASFAAEGKGSDTEFAYIAGVDEEDVPKNIMAKKWYPNRNAWVKANPSLGKTVRRDYVEQQVAEARSHSKRLVALAQQFGWWVRFSDLLFSPEDWERAQVKSLPEDELKDAELYLGIDLAEVHDFTALAMLWRRHGHYYLRVEQFTPLGTLKKKEDSIGQPFMEWVHGGLIKTCEGKSFDFRVLADRIKELNDGHNIVACAVDPWKRGRFDAALADAGIEYHWEHEDDEKVGLPMVYHQQGFGSGGETGLTIHESLEDARGLIYGGEDGSASISIESNPLLDWNLMNAAVKQNANLRNRIVRIDTEDKYGGKIDGLIASIMAIGLACRNERPMVDEDPWGNPEFTIG